MKQAFSLATVAFCCLYPCVHLLSRAYARALDHVPVAALGSPSWLLARLDSLSTERAYRYSDQSDSSTVAAGVHCERCGSNGSKRISAVEGTPCEADSCCSVLEHLVPS